MALNALLLVLIILLDLNGNYFVYIEGGKTKTSKVLDWAIEFEKNGVVKII